MKFHHLMTKKGLWLLQRNLFGKKIPQIHQISRKKMVEITIFRLYILASLQFIVGFQKYLLFSVAKFGYIGEGNAVSTVCGGPLDPALVRRVEGTESTAGAFPLVTNKVI
jgi:hypothetical protein